VARPGLDTASTPSSSVPVSDRAFLYGDGVFETLLFSRRVLLFEDLHRERLGRGLQRLGIDFGTGDLDASLTRVRGALPDNGGAGILRLTVTRGSGERGYAGQGSGPPRVVVQTFPLGRDLLDLAPPARVVLSPVRLAEQPLLAGIKHCNRLEQVLAATKARDAGADEAILCTTDGTVRCATAANVFAVVDGVLLTPPCDVAGVVGTRRQLLSQRLAPAAGLTLREESLTPNDLRRADALLLTNAVSGLRAVADFEGHRYPRHAIIKRLQDAYREELCACLAA